MFDHMSIGVRDLTAAGAFYDAVFAPLGHTKTHAQANEIAYGPAGARLFYLYPAAGDRVAGQGTHIAFRAEDRAAVDAAYHAAMARGATSIRAAGLHADIAPDYYGAVVLDPDGHKIEIVVAAMH